MTKRTHKNTHGGRRPGAGRKARTDGRKRRHVSIPLTSTEWEIIKDIPPDKRRQILLEFVKC